MLGTRRLKLGKKRTITTSSAAKYDVALPFCEIYLNEKYLVSTIFPQSLVSATNKNMYTKNCYLPVFNTGIK